MPILRLIIFACAIFFYSTCPIDAAKPKDSTEDATVDDLDTHIKNSDLRSVIIHAKQGTLPHPSPIMIGDKKNTSTYPNLRIGRLTTGVIHSVILSNPQIKISYADVRSDLIHTIIGAYGKCIECMINEYKLYFFFEGEELKELTGIKLVKPL